MSAEAGKELQEEEIEFSCRVVRTGRRTVSLQVNADGGLVLRAPLDMTIKEAMEFARRHEDWILKSYRKFQQTRTPIKSCSDNEIEEYRKKLRPVIEHRAAYYADMMGVSYGRISIRDQKTRWGSCSAKGNLNFNWRLYLLPPELLDYVVVHELAHRLEMNHSARFWGQVERILPDYIKMRRQLKEYSI